MFPLRYTRNGFYLKSPKGGKKKLQNGAAVFSFAPPEKSKKNFCYEKKTLQFRLDILSFEYQKLEICRNVSFEWTMRWSRYAEAEGGEFKLEASECFSRYWVHQKEREGRMLCCFSAWLSLILN